jgi:hypothetical protein
MDAEGLFRPDSRTLGGSPGSDLALYGGVPFATFLAPPTQNLSFAAHAPDGAGSAPSPAATALARAGTPAEAEPSPVGFGEAAPQPVPAATAAHTAAPAAAASAAEPFTGSLLPAGFSGAEHALLAPLVSSASSQDAAAPSAPVAAALPADAGARSLAAPTLATVADAAPGEALQTPAGASVVAAADSVIVAATEAATPVLQVAPAVGAVADDVQDLLGSDPAGGIATLVSLVSVSDVLDLGQAGADVPAADPALAMLDTLSADLLPPDAAGDAPIPLPEHHDDPAPAPLPGVPDPLHDLPGDAGGGLGLGL